MSAIPANKLKIVKRLYYHKLYSAKQIAEELDVLLDAVYYFMRHYGLKRRSFSEDNRLRFEKKKPSFTLKGNLTRYDRELKILGTVLYWGEGYKGKKASIVDFANSDPKMVSIFTHFLRTICGIKENKLRIFLYCYSNQNVNKLINFWSKLTKIPKQQFSRPYVRKDFKQAKQNVMLYGLVHIRYGDKKLLLLIKKWIEDYKIKFARR